MSSRYKFQITGQQDDDRIQWELTSRTGCVWKGTLFIEGVTDDGKVHFDIHTDSPTNTPIPYKGMTLMKHRLHKMVIDAIIQAVQQYV